ncbi:MAG: hypothetical protein R3A10_20345 [Caldilineaceae bacterium]
MTSTWTARGPLPVAMPWPARLAVVVLDTHELTAEAVATCDMTLLRRAMLTDPLVNPWPTPDALIKELMAAERGVLGVRGELRGRGRGRRGRTR